MTSKSHRGSTSINNDDNSDTSFSLPSDTSDQFVGNENSVTGTGE